MIKTVQDDLDIGLGVLMGQNGLGKQKALENNFFEKLPYVA